VQGRREMMFTLQVRPTHVCKGGGRREAEERTSLGRGRQPRHSLSWIRLLGVHRVGQKKNRN
jgi:hypothetical protein